MFHAFHKIEQNACPKYFSNMWINPVDTRKKSFQMLKFQRYKEWSFPHAQVEKIVYDFLNPCGKVADLEK